MKFFNKIIIFIFLVTLQNNLKAEIPYFVDFKYILNQSEAGKKAQQTLKNKLDSGIKKFKKKKKIFKKKKKIIQQKNNFCWRI